MRSLIAFVAYNALLTASLYVAGLIVAPMEWVYANDFTPLVGALIFLVAEAGIIASTIGPVIAKWAKGE